MPTSNNQSHPPPSDSFVMTVAEITAQRSPKINHQRVASTKHGEGEGYRNDTLSGDEFGDEPTVHLKPSLNPLGDGERTDSTSSPPASLSANISIPSPLKSLMSLYTLRSPDTFWPNFYLVTWFLFNVLITLYSKALFSVYRFPYPLAMTAIHMFWTSVGVNTSQSLGLYSPKKLSPEMWRTVIWFSFIFTVNIWLSNASLLAVSVNLHQVTRTTIPLFTMVISWVVYGEVYPLTVLPSVLLVIVGVALTVWGDIDFTVGGVLLVFLGCLFSSLKGLVTQKTQVGALGLSSLDLLRYLSPLAIAQLICLAFITGELPRVLYEPTYDFWLVFHLTCLGWVAFGLNFVSFRCAALLNPLTLNIAGNVKQVLTCTLSLGLFGGVLSPSLSIGIVGTAVGAYWYSVEMQRWRAQQKASPSPPSPSHQRGPSSHSSPSTLSKEGMEEERETEEVELLETKKGG